MLGFAEAERHPMEHAQLRVRRLSTSAFETLWSIAASMPGRWRRIFRPSSTKAGMRQRAAQASHSSSIVSEMHALAPDRETELLFHQVRAIERRVRLRDLGELALLAAREVLGVLPERETRPLQLCCACSVMPASARRVPDLASHLVEGVGRPLHDMEAVDAQRRAGGTVPATTSAIHSAPSAETTVILSHRSSPRRSKKPRRVFLSRPTAAQTSRPESWSTTTVRVSVPALVADLVDPDPRQAVEGIVRGPSVSDDPGDDRADGPPGDAHQLGDRGLRRVGDEPGNLVVEVPGVARAVAGPRHLGDGRAVRRAVHPGRVGLEEALNGPEVETPPPPPSLALVIAGCTHPAPTAPPLGRPPRSHMDDDDVRLRVDLHVLDHRRLVDTDASAATRRHRATPFSSPRLREPQDSSET